MRPSFQYDVALSYVAEDALTARKLMQRLQPRLRAPIFDPIEDRDGDGDGGTRALDALARVVVVLHQRLWGETPTTQRDRAAIQHRIARQGADFLVVLPLERGMEPPDWMAGARARTPLSCDGASEVEIILAAVRLAGGATHPAEGDAAPGAPAPTNLVGVPDAAQSPFKIATAAQREVAVVMAEIQERIDALRARFPDLPVEVRRTPERCVVQARDVGLSVSWLRPSATLVGDGTLLLIEWDGVVTFPGAPAHRRGATALREDMYHLEAVAWPAWNWSADDAPMRKYTSSDLASLCVRLVARRLEQQPGCGGVAAGDIARVS